MTHKPYRLISPTHPDISQKAANILKLPTDHKVMQAIRQSGKSSMCIRLASNRALRGNYHIVVCAPTVQRLSLLRSKIVLCVGVEELLVNNTSQLVFKNGSVINFCALHNDHTVRGLSPDLAIVDDAAECDNKGLADLLTYSKNSFIVSTRPFNKKNNEFWKRWKAAKKVRHGCYTMDAKDCKHLPKSYLENMKKMMSPELYKREFTIAQR